AIEYKLGARGLRSIVETVMVDAMYDVPSLKVDKFTVDADYVREKLDKANFDKVKLADNA
ncbi:MAG: ATP-dependent Clp protease ATP-binding subunit ClpX, partial [Muribaculaceae bacterium]|nr:ATP-dependent Clp protease ATP-binding subunit ClpX [Muribaculaceae bacterium]